MGSFRGRSRCSPIAAVGLLLCLSMVVGGLAQTGTLADNYYAWTNNVRFTTDGKGVELILDALSASGVSSKDSYLFGSFGAWIKLPPFDSAGTVSTFYMSSTGDQHCEFDFEFLGNQSGQPFLLHTNVFVDGVGGREQQIYLGFDASADFHYYSFEWHKDLLVFSVDGNAIRMFKNGEAAVPTTWKYANHQAMGLFLSIWDGSSWATQGGKIPINWASAPFVATYRDFQQNGCLVNAVDVNGVQSCQINTAYADGPALTQPQIDSLQKVRTQQLKYNYCDDRARYPDLAVSHPECSHNIL